MLVINNACTFLLLASFNKYRKILIKHRKNTKTLGTCVFLRSHLAARQSYFEREALQSLQRLAKNDSVALLRSDEDQLAIARRCVVFTLDAASIGLRAKQLLDDSSAQIAEERAQREAFCAQRKRMRRGL